MIFSVSKNLSQNVKKCVLTPSSHDNVAVASLCNICSANIRHVWGQLCPETCEAFESESDMISADNKMYSAIHTAL